MNWHRLGKLALVGISTFAVIALAAFIYIRLFGPFVTIHRLVAFIGTMLRGQWGNSGSRGGVGNQTRIASCTTQDMFPA